MFLPHTHKGTYGNLEVIDMIISLIVGIVSWVDAYVELIKLHVLNMSSFLYIIYASMKLSKKRKDKEIKSPSNEVRCSQIKIPLL